MNILFWKEILWPKPPNLSFKVKHKLNFLLVNPWWLLELKLRNIFSRGKIKVGFGPIESGEDDLNTRKWRIDPIVNYLNRKTKKYVADIFFNNKNLERFDVLVIIRNFDDLDKELISELKKKNIVIIYDIIDNPLGSKRSAYENVSFFKLLNGVIVSSPEQEKDITKHANNLTLIEHPVINKSYKKLYYKSIVKIVWQGYWHNHLPIKKTSEIIDKIAKKNHNKLSLIYHTIAYPYNKYCKWLFGSDNVKYIRWNTKNSFKTLSSSDIGITIKDLDDKWEKRKPATKVITYMAAGLPVICTPTESDKLIIEHGKTGYFAYDDQDWHKYLNLLIENPSLREKIGRAGREHVIKNYSVEKISQKYINFFDKLIDTQHETS